MTNNNKFNVTFFSFLKNIYQLFLESLTFVKDHKIFFFILIITQLFVYFIDVVLMALSFYFNFKQPIILISILGILGFLMFVILNITLIKYIHRNGEFSFQIFKFDLKKLFLPVTGVLILLLLVIAVGYFFLIIPGIYLSLSYLLIIYFAICLNQSFTEASENSSKLMDGYKFYFFLLYVIISIITSPVYFIMHVMMSTENVIGVLFIDFIFTNFIYVVTTITLYLFWKQQLTLAKNSEQQEIGEVT